MRVWDIAVVMGFIIFIIFWLGWLGLSSSIQQFDLDFCPKNNHIYEVQLNDFWGNNFTCMRRVNDTDIILVGGVPTNVTLKTYHLIPEDTIILTKKWGWWSLAYGERK